MAQLEGELVLRWWEENSGTCITAELSAVPPSSGYATGVPQGRDASQCNSAQSMQDGYSGLAPNSGLKYQDQNPGLAPI